MSTQNGGVEEFPWGKWACFWEAEAPGLAGPPQHAQGDQGHHLFQVAALEPEDRRTKATSLRSHTCQ